MEQNGTQRNSPSYDAIAGRMLGATRPAALPNGKAGASALSVVLPAKTVATQRRPKGKLLYKLLPLFLGLSILPVLLAGWLLIQVGDDYVQKESRGVKMGVAKEVAGNVYAYLDNVKN